MSWSHGVTFVEYDVRDIFFNCFFSPWFYVYRWQNVPSIRKWFGKPKLIVYFHRSTCIIYFILSICLLVLMINGILHFSFRTFSNGNYSIFTLHYSLILTALLLIVCYFGDVSYRSDISFTPKENKCVFFSFLFLSFCICCLN